MVVDFNHIKRAVKKKENRSPGTSMKSFPFNPTAENMARWICSQIPACFKVEVQESESNIAIYEEDWTGALMRKINEIFYSLRGRGLSYGYSGCFGVSPVATLKCSFATHSTKRGVDVREILLAEVGKYPAVTVILTGGGPSLWIDRGFVDCLHRMGSNVCIENRAVRIPYRIIWTG